MRRTSRIAVLVAVVLVGAACGARVSDRQLAAVGGRASAGGIGGPAAAGPAADGALAAGPGAEQAGAVATGAGGQGPATPTGAGGSGRTPAAGRAAAGDNGGATDVGVTGDTIRLGNVSTLSGPVPGLFQGAVVGSLAYAAYQNAQGGIHGRRLEVDVRDDGLDLEQNRAQTAELADRVFALSGSVSVQDAGGAAEVAEAGIPDVGVGLSEERRQQPTYFSPVPTPGRGYRTGQFLWYRRQFPEAVTAVGTLYGDVSAAKTSHQDMRNGAESVGWRFVYERGFQATETDFTADVVRMRQEGVQMVYLVAADEKAVARIAKAMAQQNFEPQVFASGPAGYDSDLLTLGGAAVEGLYVDQQLAMYAGEDAGRVPEVALMNEWVERVKPGYSTDLYVAWAWTSMRLLGQAMEAVGPELTRTAVLERLRGVQDFDGLGMLAPGGPGTRRPPLCYVVLRVQDGAYGRVDPARGFNCEGTYEPNE